MERQAQLSTVLEEAKIEFQQQLQHIKQGYKVYPPEFSPKLLARLSDYLASNETSTSTLADSLKQAEQSF